MAPWTYFFALLISYNISKRACCCFDQQAVFSFYRYASFASFYDIQINLRTLCCIYHALLIANLFCSNLLTYPYSKPIVEINKTLQISFWIIQFCTHCLRKYFILHAHPFFLILSVNTNIGCCYYQYLWSLNTTFHPFFCKVKVTCADT